MLVRKEKKNVKENDFVWFQHKKWGKKKSNITKFI